MSKTTIPAERKRVEAKASVFAAADDSSDSEDALEGVKAATYPRASFASPSVFEERGDESPDLSANFFSNEDSSDSGDVPIRMSGSLPDIPAETLFKGSVLEDDGFFDEDDFEDVGNGEDVALNGGGDGTHGGAPEGSGSTAAAAGEKSRSWSDTRRWAGRRAEGAPRKRSRTIRTRRCRS